MQLTIKQANRIKNTLAYFIGITMMTLCLLPLVWLFIISLRVNDEIVQVPFQYIPDKLTLENYVTVITRSSFPLLFWNSFKTTLMTVIFCGIVGTFAAYSFARFNFRGKRELLLTYLMVRMFPGVLKLIPLFIMLRAIGLLDTSFGLAITYTTFSLPIFVWMMKGYFENVPPDLEDAARIDGTTRAGAMVRIILPNVKNGLMATCVFVGIGAWNEYLFALLTTQSTGARTWPVGLQLMIGEFMLPWGNLAAAGIISVVPVLFLFAIIQQTMVSQIMKGAIKG